MKFGKPHRRIISRCIGLIITLSFGAGFFLVACRPLETTPDYGSIHPRHLLTIPRAGKLHITWEARHLTVSLKGSVRQGILSLNGNISRNQDNRQFIKLDAVDVDIYLTNSTGKILKHEVLHSTDNPPPDQLLYVFQRSYKLPTSTSHIAFGYDLKAGSRHIRHFPID